MLKESKPLQSNPVTSGLILFFFFSLTEKKLILSFELSFFLAEHWWSPCSMHTLPRYLAWELQLLLLHFCFGLELHSTRRATFTLMNCSAFCSGWFLMGFEPNATWVLVLVWVFFPLHIWVKIFASSFQSSLLRNLGHSLIQAWNLKSLCGFLFLYGHTL